MSSTQSQIIFLLTTIFSSINLAKTDQLRHPLDPLTRQELDQLRTGILTGSKSPNSTTFHYVGLDEPDKQTLLSWFSRNSNPNPSPPRRALVIITTNRTTREIIFDLSTNSIVSDKVHRGLGFPMLTVEEQNSANEVSLRDPRFVASMRKRGLKIEEVICGCFTVGWFGESGHKDKKRLVKVLAFYSDKTVNLYMRPIEGVMLTVDLDEFY